MFPGNGSASVSPRDQSWLGAGHGRYGCNSNAAVDVRGSSWGPLANYRPYSWSLQYVLVATTLRLLGLCSFCFLFSITIPLLPSFLIHSLLLLHAQVSTSLMMWASKWLVVIALFWNFMILCIFLWYLLPFIVHLFKNNHRELCLC